jgi:hypothetical protein
MHQIWAQNNPYYLLTSIINFNYSIPFSICHNTTKGKELFSLKGTTYVLSSDWWIIGLTPLQTTTSLSVKKKYLVLVLWCLTPLSTIFNLHVYHAWQSVLLVEETRVPGEKHQPVVSILIIPFHSVFVTIQQRERNYFL